MGATYAIPAGEPVSFPDEGTALQDGGSFRVGRLEVTAIATAGHTDHHLSYLVGLRDSAARRVVCTGGSLLTGATGRTDLLGPELAEPLARSQWRSVRRLLTLPRDTLIYPTHGFGSFCSATPACDGASAVATVGEQLELNPAAVMDEDQFVTSMLADLPPIPAYYRYMAPLNRKGPLAPEFEPLRLLGHNGLTDAVQRAAWVIDLRRRRGFAAEHLRGTLNLELGTNLATYLGWVVPFESPFILLAEHEDEIAEARRAASSRASEGKR